MKAIIMAGGEGRRLKPVTGDLPKPLVPLLGRPMIEHIVLLLKKHGFTDICAALKYRAEDIMGLLGDGSSLGVRICYRVEESPLGTAGAVKNCADFYGDEDFLVISGDAACDFDLKSLYQLHRRRGAYATLALYRSKEPLSLGLAVTDENGLVRCFVEKPQWERVVTDAVNTGIYILSPKAMEAVPPGTPFDFARQLFPTLIESGQPVVGAAMSGYWCDVGTPLSYYRCCVDALIGKLHLQKGDGWERPPEPECHSAAEVIPAFSETSRLSFTCEDRAGLMGAISGELMSLGAEYDDGLRLRGERYEMRVAPVSDLSAISIAVSAQDAEFAQELAISVRDLAQTLEMKSSD